jgi:hypothetical protein
MSTTTHSNIVNSTQSQYYYILECDTAATAFHPPDAAYVAITSQFGTGTKRMALLLDNYSVFTYNENPPGMNLLAIALNSNGTVYPTPPDVPTETIETIMQKINAASVNAIIGLASSNSAVIQSNVDIINTLCGILKKTAVLATKTQEHGERTYDDMQNMMMSVKQNNEDLDTEISVLVKEEKTRRMYFTVTVVIIFIGILLSLVVFTYPPSNPTVSTAIGTTLIIAGILLIILKAIGKWEM